MKQAKRKLLKFKYVNGGLDELMDQLTDLGFTESNEGGVGKGLHSSQKFFLRSVSRDSRLWESSVTMIRMQVVLDQYSEYELHVLILETGESLDETLELLTRFLGVPL